MKHASLAIAIVLITPLSRVSNADEFPHTAIEAWNKERVSTLSSKALSSHSFTATRSSDLNQVVRRDGQTPEPRSRSIEEFYAKLDSAFIYSSTSKGIETRHIFKDDKYHIIRRRSDSEQWLLIDAGAYDGSKREDDDLFWKQVSKAHNWLSALWLDAGRRPDIAAKARNSYEVGLSKDRLILTSQPGDFTTNPNRGAKQEYLVNEDFRLDTMTTWYVQHGKETGRLVTKVSDVSPDYLKFKSTQTGTVTDEGVTADKNNVTTVSISPDPPSPEIFELDHYNIVIRELAESGVLSQWTFPLLIGFGVLMIGLSVWLKRKS